MYLYFNLVENVKLQPSSGLVVKLPSQLTVITQSFDLFVKVMAHLINPLATASQLHEYNSSTGLPRDLQELIFFSTQCLTQAAGVLLELPQSVTAQANVLLARYWLVDSPMSSEFSEASAAAVYLAAKMGPIPRSTRDVSNVYAYLLSSSSSLFHPESSKEDPQSYYLSEGGFAAFQSRLLATESKILDAVAFNTSVSLPHPLAITYLQTMDFAGHSKSKISSRVNQYLNTALLSPQLLYVTHQPNALATAAIYNAARDLGANTPDSEWYEVFDVDREELGFLVVAMRSVEGWIRQRKEEMPHLSKAAVTRDLVREELRRRGIAAE